MVIPATNPEKIQEMEETMKRIRSTRRGAELMASTSGSSSHSAQICDQNGRSLDIPEEENNSLVLALSLHKQGQVLLKKLNYKSSLLYLLEADDEFKKCRASILQLVDNYAILNLDISWCYMCMKSLDVLHDVTERLQRSEQFFNKSYGNNLQRLYALKGSTGEEVALFVRLYTLQGVAAYHKEQFQESLSLLRKARGYISTLEIDDSMLGQMMALGFDSVESKRALRSSNGDLRRSIDFAYSKREEIEKIRKDEIEKNRRYKLAKSLGKCKVSSSSSC